MTQPLVPVDNRTADWPRKIATAINWLIRNVQTAGGTGIWGGITGTLSDQTDLETALDGKADATRDITAGDGLTGGGDLSADRTLAVGAGTGITVNADAIALKDTAVTPDTYGDATHVPQITVDQQGRITDASEVAITGGGGGGNWDFLPPSASSFTLESGDSTQLTLTDDDDAGLLFASGTPVTGDLTRWAYRVLTDKTADWELIVKMDAVVYQANYTTAGIILRDSVGGRITRMGFPQKAPFEVDIENYNGLTGYNGSASAGSYSRVGPWLRCVHAGGTYSFFVSPSGKNWYQQYSVSDTAFLTNRADRVGFGVSLNKSGGVPILGAVSYFSLSGAGV